MRSVGVAVDAPPFDDLISLVSRAALQVALTLNVLPRPYEEI
jgi:hypothetical protein